jgi:hypothetical protein
MREVSVVKKLAIAVMGILAAVALFYIALLVRAWV